MKQTAKLMAVVVAMTGLLIVQGCLSAPLMPPLGQIYSNVTAPLDLDYQDTDTGSLKTGEATVTCFLGLFSFGDASTQTAAAAGGLSTIEHADYKYFNFLGIVQKTTVVVYGN